MLILTRKIGEAIVIGEGDAQAKITVFGIKGSQIRLGIEALKSVPVHREEVYDRIEEDKTSKPSRATLKLL